jgi:carboxylesterase
MTTNTEVQSKGILLIHGLTGSPTEMRAVSRDLQARGHLTDTPMLPGHGAGHKELLATNWRDWLAGVRAAADKLCQQREEVYVVGLCASSTLAVVLAAEDSRIKGIVLLSTHYGEISPSMPWTQKLLPLVYPVPFLRRTFYWTETPPYGLKDERLIASITAAIEESKDRQTAEHGTFRTYVESLYQSELLADEARRRAKDVKCRALLIHSLEDSWFTPVNSVRMAQDLGTQDKTVLMITGCNHVLSVDLRKHDIARWIADFAEGRLCRVQ